MSLYELSKMNPCIIAEISGNHMQDEKILIQTLEAAQDAGADMLKIQVFTPEKMVMPGMLVDNENSPWHGKEYLELYQKTMLPAPLIDTFFRWCREHSIYGFASVFDPESVEELDVKYDPIAFKVASPEINHWPLLQALARKGCSTIISLGAATLREMTEAVEMFELSNTPYALMHCVSEYPPKPEQINLMTIPLLKKIFRCPIGYSDHTIGIGASIGAVTLGAQLIEKHFILNKSMESADASFSSDPKEFKQLVTECKEVARMIGESTFYHEDEPGKTWKRSVWTMPDGSKKILRPNVGQHPREIRFETNREPSGQE